MIILMMGVAGSGKTTVGRELARCLPAPFLDADDFHPPENRRKISEGIPLTDEDRLPWLRAIIAALTDLPVGPAVLACSALRQSYRDLFRQAFPDMTTVWLTGPSHIIAERLQNRRDHFAGPALLSSQLATLEAPSDALIVDISLPIAEQIERIIFCMSRSLTVTDAGI